MKLRDELRRIRSIHAGTLTLLRRRYHQDLTVATIIAQMYCATATAADTGEHPAIADGGLCPYEPPYRRRRLPRDDFA